MLAGIRPFLERLFQDPSEELRGQLETKDAAGFERRTVVYLLLTLTLLSLVPRLLMIWRLGSVCDDGYHYLTVAAALEAGDTAPLFEVLNLNVYPPLLVLLHRAGFDWLVTAKMWGAVIGGLAVLPLFGWVRRLFDDRVAVLACLLYAVHPQLIELSVEPIREPTFWFLFMLSLYLICRMLSAPAWWCPPLAGAAVALAAYTRSEGFLLLLPLFAWSAWALYRSDQSRWRVAGRVVVCLAMTPLLVAVTNVTLLRHHSQWEWGRLGHFAMGVEWLENNVVSQFVDEPTPAPIPAPAASPVAAVSTGASAETAAAPAAPAHPTGLADLPPTRTARLLSNRKYYNVGPRLREYVERFIDAFEPVGLLFLVVGLIACWRRLLPPDRAVLLLMAAAVLGVVWIQFANYRIGGRYFLTAVLILLPIAGLGMQAVGAWLAKVSRPALVARLESSHTWALLVCLPIAIGWGDALTSRHRGRDRQAAFAEQLSRKYGPFRSVLVNRGAERFGYHALGTVSTVKEIDRPIEVLIRQHDPQLIILSSNFEPLPERTTALEYFATIGWVEVDARKEKSGEDRLLVLRRKANLRSAAETSETAKH